jgi:serine/threonine protein kinase
MGEVYLARDGSSGRRVILKTLLPQFVDDPAMLGQFLDEARIVAAIHHANVVAMFERGEDGGTHYIAMEYIEGVDASTLQREGARQGQPVPADVAAAIVRDAALGLNAAHVAVDDEGNFLHIIHRDVSPHNIMVRRDGQVKVVDFGVAFAERRATFTETGSIKGKLNYMAPEHVEGAELDGRSDQFALGAVLWELLVGRRLFDGNTPLEVARQVIALEVEPPSRHNPRVSAKLDAIVMRMLSRKREERFATCGVAAEALNAWSAAPAAVSAYVEAVVGAKISARLARLENDAESHSEELPCARCGLLQSANNSYCSGCGANLYLLSTELSSSLRAPAPVALAPPPVALGANAPSISDVAVVDVNTATISLRTLTPAATEADAKHASITAIWYRILGSDSVATQLSPQELAASLAAIHRRFQSVAERCHGVAVPLSAVDGSVLFGVAGAREDDADDALRCALAMPRMLDGGQPELDGRLALRAALATGDVRVTDAGVEGVPIENARRMCAVEDRPAILVTASTQLQTTRSFPRTAYQQNALDEDTMPFSAVELVNGGPPRTAPLSIGQPRVLAQLAVVVGASLRGDAPMPLIIGGAGAGKTCALDDAERLAHEAGLVVGRAACRPYQAQTPGHDLRQLIGSLAIAVGESMRDRGAVDVWGGHVTWRAGLRLLGLTDADQRRLCHLVTGAEPNEPEPLGVRRTLLRASVIRFLHAVAVELGLCLLIDDIHAMDPASSAILEAAVGRLLGTRAVVVATARPVLSPQALPGFARTMLDPVGAEHELADRCARASLGPRAHAAVAERAHGNPAAVNAAVHAMLARGLLHEGPSGLELGAPLERNKLPSTLPQLLIALSMTLSEEARNELKLQALVGPVWLMKAAPEAIIDECIERGLATSVRGRVAMTPTLLEVIAPTIEQSRAQHAALAERADALLAIEGASPALRDVLAHHVLIAYGPAHALQSAVRAASAQREIGVETTALEWGRRGALLAAAKTLATSHPIPERPARALFELAALATEALAEVDRAAASVLVDQILALVPARTSPRAAALARRQQGLARIDADDLDGADRALEDALELASFAADATLQARVQTDFAAVLNIRGDVDAAVSQLAAAVATVAARSADASNDAVGWEAAVELARVHLRAGRSHDATAAVAVAQAEVLRTSSLVGQAQVYGATAEIAAAEGNPAGADAAYGQAITYADAAGDVVESVQLRQDAAQHALAAGRGTDARALLLDALDFAAAGSWADGYARTAHLLSRAQ